MNINNFLFLIVVLASLSGVLSLPVSVPDGSLRDDITDEHQNITMAEFEKTGLWFVDDLLQDIYDLDGQFMKRDVNHELYFDQIEVNNVTEDYRDSYITGSKTPVMEERNEHESENNLTSEYQETEEIYIFQGNGSEVVIYKLPDNNPTPEHMVDIWANDEYLQGDDDQTDELTSDDIVHSSKVKRATNNRPTQNNNKNNGNGQDYSNKYDDYSQGQKGNSNNHGGPNNKRNNNQNKNYNRYDYGYDYYYFGLY